MTLAELRQEVIDRGYDYIDPTRIATFIQRAYRTLCSRYPWPFLEATATGPAPLEIADLKHVLSVTDKTAGTPLYSADRRWLIASNFNLEETGAPSYWYLEGNTLKVYPLSANVLTIRYVKRPAVLADSDEPLVPEEWQYLLVDGAVVNCLRDDDEYSEARALKADTDQAVLEMAHDLMNRDYQSNRSVVRTGYPGDYLG